MRTKIEMGHTIFMTIIFITIMLISMSSSLISALEISQVMVTDCTPTSFCVVWLSGEEASGEIALFQDQKGIYPVSSYTIIKVPCADPEIFTQAAKKGVLKIKAEGLNINTVYYYRLSCISMADPNIILIYPPDNSLIKITTEKEASLSRQVAEQDIRLSSNLLIADFYNEDKITRSDNTLVIANIEGASTPLSAYVGEGTSSPACVFDLYNLYDTNSHTTLETIAGAKVTFYHYKSTQRSAIREFHTPSQMPDDTPISPVGIVQEITLKEGLNYISFQVDPQNSSEIHAALSGKYSELWTYKMGTWTDLTNNELFIFMPNQGYHITATEEIILSAVGGWRIDPIPLEPGLNVVGHRKDKPVSIDEVMAPLAGRYSHIWGYSDGVWRFFDPRLPAILNSLAQIVPGKSYYIFMKEEGSLW